MPDEHSEHSRSSSHCPRIPGEARGYHRELSFTRASETFHQQAAGLRLDGAQRINVSHFVDNQVSHPIRVLFSCTGVGIFNRGIETFFREAFDALVGATGLDATLIKGAGEQTQRERVVWTLPRTGLFAPAIGRLTKRSPYAVEQWSSFAGVVSQIRTFRPHVVFYSDANLGFLLHRFRRLIGVPFKLLFSNGGPCHPPFNRTDFVQQVAPQYYDEAEAAGEPMRKHFLVPYGIHVPEKPFATTDDKQAIRTKLKLPTETPLVLSVGWIAKQHKRMDYVISEIAALPHPRPYLVLLGAMDAHSSEIIQLGNELLGSDGFCARSVKPHEVAEYYEAADIFTLASLSEGFGRVYLEALLYGLPVLADKNRVTEYVIGDIGYLADFTRSGTLTSLIGSLLNKSIDTQRMQQRRVAVSQRFGWGTLKQKYLNMFLSCIDDK